MENGNQIYESGDVVILKPLPDGTQIEVTNGSIIAKTGVGKNVTLLQRGSGEILVSGNCGEGLNVRTDGKFMGGHIGDGARIDAGGNVLATTIGKDCTVKSRRGNITSQSTGDNSVLEAGRQIRAGRLGKNVRTLEWAGARHRESGEGRGR